MKTHWFCCPKTKLSLWGDMNDFKLITSVLKAKEYAYSTWNRFLGG